MKIVEELATFSLIFSVSYYQFWRDADVAERLQWLIEPVDQGAAVRMHARTSHEKSSFLTDVMLKVMRRLLALKIPT